MNIGLYIIITNPILSYKKIAKICVSNKIKFLQLREEGLNDKNLLSIAKEIYSITNGTETNLVINNRLDIALLSGAKYLHVGQNDISPFDVKSLKFMNVIKTGISTHTIYQIESANLHSNTYIGFGPIFKTETKKDYLPVGLDNLKMAIKKSIAPVVAIGGINDTNIVDVLKSGAKNIAMVSYFMKTKDLDYKIKKINNLINEYI